MTPPFRLAPDDDSLSGLERASIPSPIDGTFYRLDRILGIGGMSIAFFALRAAPDGATPVVLKLIRPLMVRDAGPTAALIVEKESTALRRLAERVPPTPFVVRLLEAGSVQVEQGHAALDLPWLAVEYVHGGVEGGTLHERIHYSVEHTGYAFDAARAAHALACLAAGLDAIHEVGVIHRDLKPANVLCCGFGEDEIVKIADFGIARPKGITATFGGIPVGTPGYAAPEQIVLDDKRVGPGSDIFSLAAVIFRMLTGEEYFTARHEVEALEQAQARARRSIADAPPLCPELRNRPSACKAIDAALARATSPDAAHRPESAAVLASHLIPILRSDSRRLRPSSRRLESVAQSRTPTVLAGWQWTIRHRTGDDRVVRSVAWDGDGRCLAATDGGLVFWNGTSWQPARSDGLPNGDGIRFVQRVGAGRWMVGGDGGTIAHYSADGVSNVVRADDASLSFSHASGDVSDLAVLVASSTSSPPTFYALAARHWLKPATLSKAANVASLVRLEDEKWLVAGRSVAGDGFVAVYSPLYWEIRRLKAPTARAYVSCAAQPDLGTGVVVGAGGAALRVTSERFEVSEVPDAPDLSAVALDVSGRAWAASLGSLWLQQGDAGQRWRRVWHEADWRVPFVSIYADLGLVIALSADGGIVEGRAER